MDSEQLYYLAYDSHYSKGNFEQARKLYKQVVEEFPDSVEASYAWAQIKNLDNNVSKPKESSLTTGNQILFHSSANLDKETAILDKVKNEQIEIKDTDKRSAVQGCEPNDCFNMGRNELLENIRLTCNKIESITDLEKQIISLSNPSKEINTDKSKNIDRAKMIGLAAFFIELFIFIILGLTFRYIFKSELIANFVQNNENNLFGIILIFFVPPIILGYVFRGKRRGTENNQSNQGIALKYQSNINEMVINNKKEFENLLKFTIVPKEYLDIVALSAFEKYIINNQASTLKECINLYEEDLKNKIEVTDKRSVFAPEKETPAISIAKPAKKKYVLGIYIAILLLVFIIFSNRVAIITTFSGSTIDLSEYFPKATMFEKEYTTYFGIESIVIDKFTFTKMPIGSSLGEYLEVYQTSISGMTPHSSYVQRNGINGELPNLPKGNIGSKWTGSDGYTNEITAVNMTVTTAKGTYSDCIEVTTIIMTPIKLYYAKGLGLIKEESTDKNGTKNIQILTNYKVLKE